MHLSQMTLKKTGCLFILSCMLFSACNDKTSKVDKHNQNNKSKSILPEVAVIKESFTTPRDESDNVDSPALWHGGEGQNWLLATAKEGNAIIVYDAANGEKIGRFGSIGTGLGELSRPNGIAVIDDYAVVIERDNHRVQVFILPEFKPQGVFGESVLRSPYGITIDRFEGKYHLYVTDNYETPEEETPPADSLDRRVHHFAFTVEDNRVAAEHIKAFGDTSGEGVLYKVESILADRIYNRLLIAD